MVLTNLNQKGGVGKTTNTIHIGASLSMKGFKVLLIDGDPQCDLSTGTGVDLDNAEYTVLELLNGSQTSRHEDFSIIVTSDNFHILPGNPDFDSNLFDRYALKKAINNPNQNLNELYDFIFIDVPPNGISASHIVPAELALCASDFFITTIRPDRYSVENLNRFLGKVFDLQENYNHSLKFGGIYFSDVLVTKSIFKKYYRDVEETAGNMLYKTYIRQDAEVEKCADLGETIFQFQPNCRAALDYKELSDEFLKKIDLVYEK